MPPLSSQARKSAGGGRGNRVQYRSFKPRSPVINACKMKLTALDVSEFHHYRINHSQLCADK